MKIYESKYNSHIYGIPIYWIGVGVFHTEIADWEEKGTYCLSENTTPKCKEIKHRKQFKTVENAKKYYLTQLKKVLEQTLKDIKEGEKNDI